MFDDVLNLKYNSLVASLSEKVANEQEARRIRAIELLEDAAYTDSRISRSDADFSAEAAAGVKFTRLIAELRQMWEDEEVHRAGVLERRVRSHYDVVLGQLQSQLELALRMNEDADQQWMAEIRNSTYEHVCLMKSFEEKCSSHYGARLNKYVESTDHRLAIYEEDLLVLGANTERNCSALKSKIHRLRVACGKWRIDYQREVQRRYRMITVELERLYMNEIGNLLADLSAAAAQLAACHPSQMSPGLAQQEPILLKFKSQLQQLWNRLDTQPGDRINTLGILLNSAGCTESLVGAYGYAINKMRSQLPLACLVSRYEFLGYRIALFAKLAPKNGGTLTHLGVVSDYNSLREEYRTLHARLNREMLDYEQENRTPFLYRGVPYLPLLSE